MQISIPILPIFFALTLFSCGRIKSKGEEVVDKANSKIKTKKDDLIDKVFTTYNSGKSNTKYNKERFKEHLQIGLPADVKDIYAYGDFLGADYKVLIAFNCEPTTINAIVAAKKMVLSDKLNDSGLLFGEEFPWWNQQKIESIVPYKAGVDGEYWYYLWYDSRTKNTYYEEFSL